MEFAHGPKIDPNRKVDEMNERIEELEARIDELEEILFATRTQFRLAIENLYKQVKEKIGDKEYDINPSEETREYLKDCDNRVERTEKMVNLMGEIIKDNDNA